MLEIDIHKALGGSTNVNLKASFESGKITALYGPSGMGKTTVLRLIAGLDKPDSGSISWEGKSWYSNNELVPLKDRPVGMVFQDYNLFKNMTVRENLTFATKGELPQNFEDFASKFAIKSLFERKPNELSKGQQQKVSILRSLCQRNKVLLLDEPFSALDDDSILELIEAIQIIRKEGRTTIILVTHRKDVILKMADSVVILESGKQGSPEYLLEKLF